MGLITALQSLLWTPSEDTADYVEPEITEGFILEGDYVEDIYGGVGMVDMDGLTG